LSNSSSSSPAVVERQERGRRVNDGKDNERNCLRLWGLLEQVFRFDAVQSPGATPLHIVANALKENSEVRKKEPERGLLCGCCVVYSVILTFSLPLSLSPSLPTSPPSSPSPLLSLPLSLSPPLSLLLPPPPSHPTCLRSYVS
jgi:hypothetical protein